MLRLRPYGDEDAKIILSWPIEEKRFYQWTAGILGEYPLTLEKLSGLSGLMRFVLLDETEVSGFFTLRNPKETPDEVRFGFVIVDPKKRGQGYGKEMLRLGLVFARDVYRAEKATLGVFENNEAAWRCYRAAGFRDTPGEALKSYAVMGEAWPCREMEYDLTGERHA